MVSGAAVGVVPPSSASSASGLLGTGSTGGRSPSVWIGVSVSSMKTVTASNAPANVAVDAVGGEVESGIEHLRRPLQPRRVEGIVSAVSS